MSFNAVRFVRGWLGRPAGFIDRGLGYGQMDALVQRGVAEWVEEPKQDTSKFNDQNRNQVPKPKERVR